MLQLFAAMLFDPILIAVAVIVGLSAQHKITVIASMVALALAITVYLNSQRYVGMPVDYLVMTFGLRTLAALAWGLAAREIKLRWLRRSSVKEG
jgi:hypothetical protein